MAFLITRYSLAFTTLTLAALSLAPAAHAEDSTPPSGAYAVAAASVMSVKQPATVNDFGTVSFDLANERGSINASGETVAADDYLPSQIRQGDFAASTLNPLNTVPYADGSTAAYRRGSGVSIVGQNKSEFGEISSDVPGPTARVRNINRAASFRIGL